VKINFLATHAIEAMLYPSLRLRDGVMAWSFHATDAEMEPRLLVT
jgi:hypothetical protein